MPIILGGVSFFVIIYGIDIIVLCLISLSSMTRALIAFITALAFYYSPAVPFYISVFRNNSRVILALFGAALITPSPVTEIIGLSVFASFDTALTDGLYINDTVKTSTKTSAVL